MFTSKKMNKGDTNSLKNICKKYEGGKYENTSKSKLRILDIYRNKRKKSKKQKSIKKK